jgi:hypothetical protein
MFTLGIVDVVVPGMLVDEFIVTIMLVDEVPPILAVPLTPGYVGVVVDEELVPSKIIAPTGAAMLTYIVSSATVPSWSTTGPSFVAISSQSQRSIFS